MNRTTLDASIRPSPQGEIGIARNGEVVVPRMPGAGAGSVASNYRDQADQVKPQKPASAGVPFELRDHRR